jgi:SAM-dependent methyltransferase
VLTTTTNIGLHDFVLSEIQPRYHRPGGLAIDLGAGPGAMAARLRSLGWEVHAADRTAEGLEADVPFTQADFNKPDFASALGGAIFDLVVSVEVIEHVESPIGFLRNVGRLLKPDGVAILTTPNVDSLPARVKFLLRGTIRTMDEASEPTHISPIFWDLLRRQYLPLAGLELVEHRVFPPRGFQLTRPGYAGIFHALAPFFPGNSLWGDNHVFVLRRRPEKEAR